MGLPIGVYGRVVDFDVFEYVRIHAALHDPVGSHPLREADLSGLIWLDQEDIFVIGAADRQMLLVGHRIDRTLVQDIVRIPLRIGGCVFQTVFCIVPFLLEPYLISKIRHNGLCVVHTGKLLRQLYGPGFDRSQVKSHVQVGRARASLHVEDTHGVRRVRVEDPVAFVILYKDSVHIGLRFCV